jgi:hypothetical protein
MCELPHTGDRPSRLFCHHPIWRYPPQTPIARSVKAAPAAPLPGLTLFEVTPSAPVTPRASGQGNRSRNPLTKGERPKPPPRQRRPKSSRIRDPSPHPKSVACPSNFHDLRVAVGNYFPRPVDRELPHRCRPQKADHNSITRNVSSEERSDNAPITSIAIPGASRASSSIVGSGLARLA